MSGYPPNKPEDLLLDLLNAGIALLLVALAGYVLVVLALMAVSAVL